MSAADHSVWVVDEATGRATRLNADALTRCQSMMAPVRCRCGKIYDLAAVHVKARYADCSMWDAPCCGHLTDDRPPYPGSLVHYVPLDRTGRAVSR